jgi:acyl-CoA reductase-like NAD-dependent aldehyde dehydrogenase
VTLQTIRGATGSEEPWPAEQTLQTIHSASTDGQLSSTVAKRKTVKPPHKRIDMLIKAAELLEAQKEKLTGIDMLIKAAELL